MAKRISIIEARKLDWRGADNPNPFAGWTQAAGLSEFEEELLHSLTTQSFPFQARPVLYEFEGASIDLPEIEDPDESPLAENQKGPEASQNKTKAGKAKDQRNRRG